MIKHSNRKNTHRKERNQIFDEIICENIRLDGIQADTLRMNEPTYNTDFEVKSETGNDDDLNRKNDRHREEYQITDDKISQNDEECYDEKSFQCETEHTDKDKQIKLSDSESKRRKIKKKKLKKVFSEEDQINDDSVVHNVNVYNDSMSYLIQADDWSKIKPIEVLYQGKQKRMTRRLQNGWTDVFCKAVSTWHPGCVLAFRRSHRVKQNKSRKQAGPFVYAKGVCTGAHCSRGFTFTIDQEPDSEAQILLHVKAEGFALHDETEINRRNISGEKRQTLANELKTSSAAAMFSHNLNFADQDKLKIGNFTEVPNKIVLRKIIAEIVEKEQLHRNVLAELEVLKESHGQNKYIHDIGMDPFTIILISDEQIRLVRELSKKEELDIYIDATGSILQNIKGQKRPYLYSIVIKPYPRIPSVSIADMVTTQHTIPRIELFLGTFKREVLVGWKKLKVRKVETDYSFALMQSVLKTFNTTTLKRYIKECFHVIVSENRTEMNFTCLHLCSAHMIKDFTRSMGTYKVDKIEKKTKHLMIKLFALLQNTSSLDDAREIYKHACVIFLSKQESTKTNDSLKRVKMLFKELDQAEGDEDVNEDDHDQQKELDENQQLDRYLEEMTIKEASPFTKEFEKVKKKVVSKIIHSDEHRPNNLFFRGLSNV